MTVAQTDILARLKDSANGNPVLHDAIVEIERLRKLSQFAKPKIFMMRWKRLTPTFSTSCYRCSTMVASPMARAARLTSET